MNTKISGMFFYLLLFFFFLVVCVTPNLAQGICPLPSLRVDSVKGKVVTQGKNEDEPLSQAKVELRRLDDKETLVASTVTDNGGLFEITSSPKGKYRLVIWFSVNNQLYFKYYIKLNVVKRVKKPKEKMSILVKLGVDCFNSEASLINDSQIRKNGQD